MNDSTFKTVPVPLASVGGQRQAPAIIAKSHGRPLRVVLRNFAVGAIFVAQEPFDLGLAGDAGFSSNAFFVDINTVNTFILAPKQELFASAVAAGTTLVSLAISEIAYPLRPPSPGMDERSRFQTTTLPLVTAAGGNVARPLAKADRNPARVQVRNLTAAGSTVVVNSVTSELNPSDQFGFRIPGAADNIFLLAPGQSLYGMNLAGSAAPVTVAVNVSDGVLITDHVLVL